jgi:hypothetical protein
VTEKEKITWRSFADAGNAGAGPIATKWNLSATPTFYLLDHKGVIRYKWAGPPGEKVLDAALDKLIQAAEENGENTPRRRDQGEQVVSPSQALHLTRPAGSFKVQSGVW